MIKKFLIFTGILAIIAGIYFISTNGKAAEEARKKVRETKELVEDAAKDVVKGIKADTKEIADAISNKSREAIVEVKELGIVVKKKSDNIVDKTRTAANDAAITARVKTRLTKDREISGLDINVTTQDGKVTLSGKADSPQEIAKIIDTVLNTEGVKEVVSAITIKKRG